MGLAPTTVRARAEAISASQVCFALNPTLKPENAGLPRCLRGAGHRPKDVAIAAHHISASWWQLMKRLALPVSSRAARQQLRGDHARRRRRATSTKNAVARRRPQAGERPDAGPTGAASRPAQGLPQGNAGHQEVSGLAAPRALRPAPGVGARDYRTQSQAAFDAPTVSRNAEKPTLSTEMLQRSSIAPHVTEKALTSTTDRNYAETLRARRAPQA